MTARLLTGSKQEIAEKVAQIDGDIHEAIVFIEQPSAPSTQAGPAENIFSEMESFTVFQVGTDDSREAIYQRLEGE